MNQEPVIVYLHAGDNPPEARLYYGRSSLEVAMDLPDNSVQMIACSPPYWGLRSYGTEPQVWGGDPECDHEWGDSSVVRKGSTNGRLDTDSTLVSAGSAKTLAPGEGNDVGDTHQYRTDPSSSCSKCWAWRGDLGLEPTAHLFVQHLVMIFRELRRVLRDDGTLWVNMGDSYSGSPVGSFNGGGFKDKSSQTGGRDLSGVATSGVLDKSAGSGVKPKDLCGIPWRVALALQEDGWYLRNDIIWSKPNPMPESVTDRFTRSHEYVFLLSKSDRYYFDQEAVREPYSERSLNENSHRERKPGSAFVDGTPGRRKQFGGTDVTPNEGGRNRRTVWNIATQCYGGAHFATWPEALVELMIRAGSSEKGCCPHCGAPWRQVVEKEKPPDYGRGSQAWTKNAHQPGNTHQRNATGGLGLNPQPSRINGWAPTCKCKENVPVRCIVLDPFSGSGTTGRVSLLNGRNYVGIDLGSEFLELACRRIRGEVAPDATPEVSPDDSVVLDFFGEESK